MVDPLDERDDNLDVPDDPDAVDAETFAEWVEKEGEVVREVLEEMTAVYADDGEKRTIKNASISHVRPDADYVGIQFDLPAEVDPEVSGANILRLLDDLNSHEMSHKNWSDLHAKKEISDSYPGFGKLPGHIQNLVEDEYIDARRKYRWKGLKEKLAYYVWLHMNTESRAPPADEVYENEGMENALMNALLQTALAGYVNGIEDAPDEIAECMARVEPLFDKLRALAVRDEKNDIPGRETADERATITHAIINILARYLPDPDEVDTDKMDERSRDTTSQPEPAESPSSPDGDAEIELSDKMEDAVEDTLEQMADDDNAPDPMPDMDSDAEIDLELDAADMGEAMEDSDDGGDASDPGSSESGAASDGAESGSLGDSTDTDGDADGSADDGSVRPELEALVDEHGAENLVIDG